MRKFNIFLLSLIICQTYAQNSLPKKKYYTKSIGSLEAPKIDGSIDEAAWNLVNWEGNFVQWFPNDNENPKLNTEFKIIYDSKNLYIAIMAWDPEPDKIEKRLARRDDFAGDWVEVNIDSYRDLRSGFSFNVTAAGVKGDEFISNNGVNWDPSWNPIWYTKSKILEEGWSAEMQIPLTQLRFGEDMEQIWGLQIQRRLFREAERSLWQRIAQGNPGWISEFGELHGLKDLEWQRQLEIQPYTVTRLENYNINKDNPFRDNNEFKTSFGLDGKFGVTNDLTLDFTINPDFGQVEADPSAIALDGFEIFFREQRPFFVENKNIFDYPLASDRLDNVFFSRRIGRTPQRNIPIGSHEFLDQPINTSIIGAAKFSGKTKDGWSIGILESLTDKEFAKISSDGNTTTELIEPMTNYFVGRVQKDFNKRNSFVGGIFTATNRNIERGVAFLREAAYSGGVDFKHQWKDRKYYFEGYAIFSHVIGSEESILLTQQSLAHLFQRTDAGHVEVDSTRTSLTGTAGRFEVGKAGGGNWSYNSGIFWSSPELELNDIGFLRQTDEIKQYNNVKLQSTKPFGAFREGNIRLNQFTTFDFEGNYNRSHYEMFTTIFTNSFWKFDFRAAHKPRIFSNTFLRGGPRWNLSGENYAVVFINSDNRKKLFYNFGVVYSEGRQNNFSLFNIGGGITYQPINAFQLSISTDYVSNPTLTQYVTERNFVETPRYILATIDNKTLSSTIRLNYTFNPNLTLQFYGQPFVSRVRFSDFKYVTDPIAKKLENRFQLYNDNQISFDQGYSIDEDLDGTADYSFSDPDFSFVQLRTNLVLRWEYIPGSELFFVWSKANTGFQNPSDGLLQSLDNQLLNTQGDNTFLIKATYRFR
ncbi:DUF5916 domain-containing protein [Flagellimonas meishanensis]|uniref:DUF5916 domain-containing protein n=1 Tax=Flagellimonas meishanensis TaxID=2873264 RepID=UPI001CA7681F|nr:DUF5916 domain-containing protein [[Muricauda] meishanensis]